MAARTPVAEPEAPPAEDRPRRKRLVDPPPPNDRQAEQAARLAAFVATLEPEAAPPAPAPSVLKQRRRYIDKQDRDSARNERARAKRREVRRGVLDQAERDSRRVGLELMRAWEMPYSRVQKLLLQAHALEVKIKRLRSY